MFADSIEDNVNDKGSPSSVEGKDPLHVWKTKEEGSEKEEEQTPAEEILTEEEGEVKGKASPPPKDALGDKTNLPPSPNYADIHHQNEHDIEEGVHPFLLPSLLSRLYSDL